MEQPTCAERLPESLKVRLYDLRLLMKAASEEELSESEVYDLDMLGVDVEPGSDVAESARERLYDYGLSVERRVVLRWTLSTGGPADGFDVAYDDEGEAVRASYWFQDWFDGAETPVDQDTMELVSDLVNPDGIFTDLNMR